MKTTVTIEHKEVQHTFPGLYVRLVSNSHTPFQTGDIVIFKSMTACTVIHSSNKLLIGETMSNTYAVSNKNVWRRLDNSETVSLCNDD